MIDLEYRNACTEVLEILKHIPKEDYDKIPHKKIEVFEMDKNMDYFFQYDVNKTLDEQNVSKKTRLILAIFYRDYWATERQREMILAKEKYDMNRFEQEKRERYNPDNLFKKNQTANEVTKEENVDNIDTQMIEYKEENIIYKIITKLKVFWKNLKRRL